MKHLQCVFTSMTEGKGSARTCLQTKVTDLGLPLKEEKLLQTIKKSCKMPLNAGCRNISLDLHVPKSSY